MSLQLEAADQNGVTIVMSWRNEMQSRTEPPIMHGGIVASLIDVCGLYTVLAAGGDVRSTAYLHVDYHRSVIPGLVRVTGRAIRIGRSISIAESFIYGTTSEPLASGRGGYVA